MRLLFHKFISGLDQDIVGEEYIKAGLHNCAFSIDYYTAHCPASHNAHARLNEVVTYHTSCVEGLNTKKWRMHKVMQLAHDKKNELLGAVL